MKENGIGKIFIGNLKYFLILVVLILLFTIVISFHRISKNTMSPILEEKDIVLVGNFFKRWENFKRNDIVSYKENGKVKIRRVIGLPGEKIEVKDGVLYINDIAYEETFLEKKRPNFTFDVICDEKRCPENQLPEDTYLFLEDNSSSEEIDADVISKDQIIGKVFFRVWPFSKMGVIH